MQCNSIIYTYNRHIKFRENLFALTCNRENPSDHFLMRSAATEPYLGFSGYY